MASAAGKRQRSRVKWTLADWKAKLYPDLRIMYCKGFSRRDVFSLLNRAHDFLTDSLQNDHTFSKHFPGDLTGACFILTGVDEDFDKAQISRSIEFAHVSEPAVAFCMDQKAFAISIVSF